MDGWIRIIVIAVGTGIFLGTAMWGIEDRRKNGAAARPQRILGIWVAEIVLLFATVWYFSR